MAGTVKYGTDRSMAVVDVKIQQRQGRGERSRSW